MEIILTEKIEKLGNVGDLVKVKSGFARNYLLPQEKALRATEKNKVYFEEQKKEILARNEEIRKEAEKLYNKINNKTVIIISHASDEGKLYGSIVPRDIAMKASEFLKVEIKKSQIILANPIREIGLYQAKVRVHADFVAIIKINVARSEAEAKENLSQSKKALEKNDEAKEDNKGKAASEKNPKKETKPEEAKDNKTEETAEAVKESAES